MNWKREILALVFGMLIILIIFGDALQGDNAGNLDTVFGQAYGHLMDVIYPLASILVFLLYGKFKGGIKIHIANILLFLVFLVGLSLIQFDDFFVLFHHTITLPWVWWTTVRWCFLFISVGSFFAFGWVSGKLQNRQ